MTETTEAATVNPREPHAFVPGSGEDKRWCEICDHSPDAYVHASETERQAFDLAHSPEAERDAQALRKDREWFGYLTTANYQAVTERIDRMLRGKKYTWVASLSPALAGKKAYHHRPEVRTGQRFESIKGKLLTGDHAPIGHITVSDSYGVWGIDSTFASQADAHAGKPERRTYLHFQRDRWGDRLEIEHYAISGNHLWWVVSVENSGW